MNYIKEDCWKDGNIKHLLNENVWKLENELDDNNIDIENGTKQMMKNSTPAIQKCFTMMCANFFELLSNKPAKNLPLDNSLLRDL